MSTTGAPDCGRLAQVLRRDELGRPQIVVDLAAFDRNLGRVLRRLGTRRLRVAVKSLPCVPLIDRVLAAGGSQSLMAFDLPTLQQSLQAWPHADVLMGKPLVTAAVARTVTTWTRHSDGPTVAARVHWLVDTAARAVALAAVARASALRLGAAIELDLGMHRGGAADIAALDAILDAIAAHGDVLELRGFMGYDAHVARAPWPRRPVGAARHAARRYAQLVQYADTRFPAQRATVQFRNGGGSPTFDLLPDSTPCDDVALGSVLVKPSDFDLPWLVDLEPTAWIASPILKDLPHVELPYFERVSRLLGGSRRTLFIHGGRWMARPAWPPGLAESPLYGRSSNQQCLTVPAAATAGVDDYVFFRPTQSEVVLAQFGFITAVHDDGKIEHWTTFTPTENGFDE